MEKLNTFLSKINKIPKDKNWGVVIYYKFLKKFTHSKIKQKSSLEISSTDSKLRTYSSVANITEQLPPYLENTLNTINTI